MKALKLTLIVIAGLVLLFFIVAAFLPADKIISYSQSIQSPAKTVFDQVNSFIKWESWSPWTDDTTMINTYEGPESGVGAKSIWTSKNSGNGSQTIIESIPFKFIKMELDLGEGSKSESSWSFAESDSGTIVTWSLIMKDLEYPFGRYFGLFSSKMMNPFFKKGLEQLSDLVSKMPKWSTSGIIETSIDPLPCLQIHDSCTITEFESKLGQCFGEISNSIKAQKSQFAGAPFVVYLSWNPEGFIPMIIGIPVDRPLKSGGRVKAGYTPSGKVLKAFHKGNYNLTGESHAVMDAYINEKKLEVVGAPWEIYVTDPMTETDTALWITEVYYPIK